MFVSSNTSVHPCLTIFGVTTFNARHNPTDRVRVRFWIWNPLKTKCRSLAREAMGRTSPPDS